MTISRAAELMAIERECVEKQDICDHDCGHCALAQDDKELVEAYGVAIDILTATSIIAGIPSMFEQKIKTWDDENQEKVENFLDRVFNLMDEEMNNGWGNVDVQKLDKEGAEGSRSDTD